MIEKFRESVSLSIDECRAHDEYEDADKYYFVLDKLDLFIGEHKETEPESPWLPIEGAPRNGTVVDLLIDGAYRVPDCVFDEPCGYPGTVPEQWITERDGEPLEQNNNRITHFCYPPKIPLPPKEAGT